jgi:hypothetical protein
LYIQRIENSPEQAPENLRSQGRFLDKIRSLAPQPAAEKAFTAGFRLTLQFQISFSIIQCSFISKQESANGYLIVRFPDDRGGVVVPQGMTNQTRELEIGTHVVSLKSLRNFKPRQI